MLSQHFKLTFVSLTTYDMCMSFVSNWVERPESKQCLECWHLHISCEVRESFIQLATAQSDEAAWVHSSFPRPALMMQMQTDTKMLMLNISLYSKCHYLTPPTDSESPVGLTNDESSVCFCAWQEDFLIKMPQAYMIMKMQWKYINKHTYVSLPRSERKYEVVK